MPLMAESASAESMLQEVLAEGARVERVEAGVVRIEEEARPANEYDSPMGWIYDVVACSRSYNRWMWGYDIDLYPELLRTAVSSAEGWLLDAGCGSLAFTADVYAAGIRRRTVLLDQSLGLIQKAKRRLLARCHELPRDLVFVHGDALKLPFRSGAFSTVLSLNLLHVLERPEGAVAELKRVLGPEGSIHLTTLVKCGRWSDAYLARLGRSGLLFPRSVDEVLRSLAEAGLRCQSSRAGNLAVVTCH
jgi:SAM-dependent methyltransferase